MTAPAAVYLALGSNVGDRRQNLINALERLGPDVEVEAVSSLYETDPIGPIDQQDFYNAACRGTTQLMPEELLTHIKQVERDVGRTASERWGPREIDIDILLYDDLVLESGALHIPHPEMTARAFVLVPLAEIAPDEAHPMSGRTIKDLTADVDASGVRLIEGRGWKRPPD